MLKKYLRQYSLASYNLGVSSRKHTTLMMRVFSSFGASAGLLACWGDAIGNKHSLSVFAIFAPVVFFIYGCVMLILADICLRKEIRKYERQKWDAWIAIDEISNLEIWQEINDKS